MTRLRFTCLFVLLWAAVIPVATAQSPVVVEVIQVEDGDTLQVLWDQDRRTVRLFGIDAPENGQRYYSRARELVTALAAGEKVQLIPEGEQDGVLLARVRLPDSRELNQVMVRNGLAWYVQSSGATDLARLEERAREERRGLWSEEHPSPPWEYRQMDGLHNGELIERLDPEVPPQRATEDSFWQQQRTERENADRAEQSRVRTVQAWYEQFRDGIRPVESSLNAVLEARTKYQGMGVACRNLALSLIEFKKDEYLVNPPDKRIRNALTEMLGSLGHMVRACQNGQELEMAEFYTAADRALSDLAEALKPYTEPKTASPEG